MTPHGSKRNMKNTKALALTPRQSKYLHGYHDPASATFGNSYQSAVAAGYSVQTARNFNHLQPEWLSENIGQMTSTAISPGESRGLAFNRWVKCNSIAGLGPDWRLRPFPLWRARCKHLRASSLHEPAIFRSLRSLIAGSIQQDNQIKNAT
jgi:hypothetical protein